jgi:hypothetical protein
MSFDYYYPISLGNKELISEVVSNPLNFLPLGRFREAYKALMPVAAIYFYDGIGLYQKIYMASSYGRLPLIGYAQLL